jgi:ribonucleoside-diphosphate reductase subunit M1
LNSASVQNTARLECEINHDRDFDYDYFGFKILQRSYLLKVGGKAATYVDESFCRHT